MQSTKPEVTDSWAERVVREQLGQPPTGMTPVRSGLIAATFECFVGDRPIIVQFNDSLMAHGTRNERFLRDRLRLAGVPVRDLTAEGEDGGLSYTIAAKAPGRELMALPPAEFRAALPSVFRTLSAMASVDIADTSGYGHLDRSGKGTSPSWRDHLLHIADEEPGMFYGCWHSLFESTFLERKRFDDYHDRMRGVLERISPPRRLVHGGFGYTNVLVHEGQVTVVLDWVDACYGDALFDLAYMDFWPSGFDLIGMFEEYSTGIGITHDDYRDRVLCGKYYTGLDAMRFYAKRNDEAAYAAAVRVLDGL